MNTTTTSAASPSPLAQTRCVGFTHDPLGGECGAHTLARQITEGVVGRGHRVLRATYTEWAALPAQEHPDRPTPAGIALTLVSETGWANLVCDSSGRRAEWTLFTADAAPAIVELPLPTLRTSPGDQGARLALAVDRALRGSPLRPVAGTTQRSSWSG